LKDIYVFSQALTTKSLWRLIYNECLYGKFMKIKYLKHKYVEELLKSERRIYQGVSIVSKDLVKAFPLLGQWVVSKVGRGNKVCIGEDFWIGCRGTYMLLEILLNKLNIMGIFYLEQVTIPNGQFAWDQKTTNPLNI
jgi:hypothetical protein